MTTARVTTRRTTLEKKRELVIADLLSGMTQAEVARKYSVAPGSVNKFTQRHVEALTVASLAIEKQVQDYAIANKVNRIAELDHLYNLHRQEIDQYGVTIVETTTETESADDEVKLVRVIETRDYRKGLVTEARSLLRQAAEELGSLPKTDITFNIQNNVLALSWTDDAGSE